MTNWQKLWYGHHFTQSPSPSFCFAFNSPFTWKLYFFVANNKFLVNFFLNCNKLQIFDRFDVYSINQFQTWVKIWNWTVIKFILHIKNILHILHILTIQSKYIFVKIRKILSTKYFGYLNTDYFYLELIFNLLMNPVGIYNYYFAWNFLLDWNKSQIYAYNVY